MKDLSRPNHFEAGLLFFAFICGISIAHTFSPTAGLWTAIGIAGVAVFELSNAKYRAAEDLRKIKDLEREIRTLTQKKGELTKEMEASDFAGQSIMKDFIQLKAEYDSLAEWTRGVENNMQGGNKPLDQA